MIEANPGKFTFWQLAPSPKIGSKRGQGIAGTVFTQLYLHA